MLLCLIGFPHQRNSWTMKNRKTNYDIAQGNRDGHMHIILRYAVQSTAWFYWSRSFALFELPKLVSVNHVLKPSLPAAAHTSYAIHSVQAIIRSATWKSCSIIFADLPSRPLCYTRCYQAVIRCATEKEKLFDHFYIITQPTFCVLFLVSPSRHNKYGLQTVITHASY